MALEKQRTFHADILQHLWYEVINASSIAVDCQHDITHFDADDEEKLMEEGELDGYLEEEKEHPDKYMGHHTDLRWGELGGRNFVQGCPKCEEELLKYATFLFNEGRIVTGFLKRVAEDIERDAKAVKDDLKGCIKAFGGI